MDAVISNANLSAVLFCHYAACLMPIRPSQLRLGPKQVISRHFYQIIRGCLVSRLVPYHMVNGLVLYPTCFCIPRPVCPSLAK